MAERAAVTGRYLIPFSIAVAAINGRVRGKSKVIYPRAFLCLSPFRGFAFFSFACCSAPTLPRMLVPAVVMFIRAHGHFLLAPVIYRQRR